MRGINRINTPRPGGLVCPGDDHAGSISKRRPTGRWR